MRAFQRDTIIIEPRTLSYGACVSRTLQVFLPRTHNTSKAKWPSNILRSCMSLIKINPLTIYLAIQSVYISIHLSSTFTYLAI
jgi:hypothetical protein